MNVSRGTPGRLLLALAVSGVALVVGAATAFGQGVSSSGPSVGGGVPAVGAASGIAVSGTTVGAGPVSTGVVSPWCCATASVPGLTVVGQATMNGQGTTARDAAITKATQDALDQGKTAAAAAGIQLGSIVDMQVSAMPFVYPVMGGPVMGGAGGSSPGSIGSSGLGGSTMEPAPYRGMVSVTITWAIG